MYQPDQETVWRAWTYRQKPRRHKYPTTKTNYMDIIDILADAEAGDLLPSIKGKVVGLGQIKEKDGQRFQMFQLADLNDDEARITGFFRDPRFFLDGLQEESDCFVRILAGPPKNKRPQGIELYAHTDGTKRVKITADAGLASISYGSPKFDAPQSTEPVKENPKETPTLPLPEKKKGKGGECDALIKGYALERLYIYEMVKQVLIDEGSDYPVEKIAELATAVHINLDRKSGNKEVLPPRESTARFPKSATDNNPKQGDTPKAEDTAKSKPAAKPVPKEEVEQVEDDSHTSADDTIREYIKSIYGEKYYKQPDAKGVPVGEIFQDPLRRARACKWYFEASVNDLSEDYRKVWNAVDTIIKNAPSNIQRELTFEAMRFDQSSDVLPYEESNFLKFDTCIVRVVKNEEPALLKDPRKMDHMRIATTYFSVDKDDRVG